jgi:spore coat protein JB
VNKKSLLEQITVMDFMALDLQLRLNTHSQCAETLSKYNEAVENADRLRRQYEERYGPLTSFRSPGTREWEWSKNPWPWQESFNYAISHGEGIL